MDLRSTSIDSERLRLVPTSPIYAEDMFAEFTAEVTTFMGPKPAEVVEETFAFLAGAVDDLVHGRCLQVAILLKASSEFLGHAGLYDLTSRTPELGIWIKRSAHGNGYGREAVEALVRWAIGSVEFDYLLYPVDRRNLPSRRIPESLGGVVRRKYDRVNASGFIPVRLHTSLPVLVSREICGVAAASGSSCAGRAHRVP